MKNKFKELLKNKYFASSLLIVLSCITGLISWWFKSDKELAALMAWAIYAAIAIAGIIYGIYLLLPDSLKSKRMHQPK